MQASIACVQFRTKDTLNDKGVELCAISILWHEEIQFDMVSNTKFSWVVFR